MPRNGSGTYTVPVTYTPNTLASAADVNSNFTDVATAMTGSLPRDGQAGMVGQLKAADGILALPGITFGSDLDTGIRRTATGTYRLVSDGVDIAEISPTGFAILAGALTAQGLTPIGSGMDYWGTTAPTNWLFPYGQAISRTTYAALFAVLSTTYGAGDGSTTFNLPDKRDRASYGKGDMGGTPASRITNLSGGWEGDTLGAAGGTQTHTLSEAQLPTIQPTGTVTGSLNNITALTGIGSTSVDPVGAGSAAAGPVTSSLAITFNSPLAFTGNVFGSGQAHNNLPPGIVCNYIIYAGA